MSNDFTEFRMWLSAENERKLADDQYAISVLAAGNLPTPESVKTIIGSRIGDGREKILVHHCYWSEMQLKDGLDSLLRAANIAYADICRHEAALAASNSSAFSKENYLQDMVVDPFHKDVLAFCVSAIGVIDTTRKLCARRMEIREEVEKYRKENFDDETSSFVKDLRNNLAHGAVVVPGWEIRLQGTEVSGALTLKTYKLLALGEWSARSKTYLSNCHDCKVNLKDILGSYGTKLQEFGKFLRGVFARFITTAEVDFYNIVDEFDRRSRKQWINLVVNQIARGHDPYHYLHWEFNPEEVREILRRPRHSREQVEFMISLRVGKLDCDESLKLDLYRLFAVPNEQ